jgi:propanol-preferring alcohol dehydrogenase
MPRPLNQAKGAIPFMKAMLLRGISQLAEEPDPLERATLPDPVPREGEILVQVSACGVCHTELDEIEGRTPPPRFPVVPGHQIIGRVTALGPRARRYAIGDRVGVGWIYASCGTCRACQAGHENLCREFRATGRDAHGGYAEFVVVGEKFAYRIPETFGDSEAAPLLCAGAIGYRSLRLANVNDGENLGLTGFGASAHLVLKMARHLYPASRVFVFARSDKEKAFAAELGAAWTGDTAARAPEKLAAVIDTTPAWKPIVEALGNLDAGGRLVINAIRKEPDDKDDLLNIDYPQHLWLEKEIKSVANVTRHDIVGFLELAERMAIKPEFQEYPLTDANVALRDLKNRRIRGAKVLRI